MLWRESWRADPAALPLADRHYNRQKVGSPQFVPPGSCCVLVAGDPVDALWVTSAPLAQFVRHRWAGAWVNSLYRNERPGRRSSDLILEAIAATRWLLGEPPALGMVTFVDIDQVRPKRTPGRCYLAAGFEPEGYTVDRGYLALRLPPDRMPAPARPRARRSTPSPQMELLPRSRPGRRVGLPAA